MILRINRKVTAVIILLVFAVLYALYLNRPKGLSLDVAADSATSQPERVEAKDFSFQNLEGLEFNISDFKGRVIIANFRTINCSACDIEIGYLKRFIRSLKDLEIEVLPVFLGDGEDAIRRYIEKRDIDFSVYRDDYGLSGLKYGVFVLPTSFIIDKDFRVVGKIPGAIDWNRPEVLELLKGLIDE